MSGRRFSCFFLPLLLILLSVPNGCNNSTANLSGEGGKISAAGTASPSQYKSNPVIGATFLGPSEFPATIMKKMIDEAKRRDIKLYAYDGKDSVQEQIANIKDMVSKNVDVIILNPVDADACIQCVELANAAGIPILGVNAMVNTEKLLTYVGSNDLEAGEIVMKHIAEMIEGKGEIVVLDGVRGQSSQLQRTQGILNILRSYPNIRILEEKPGNWFREEGYNLMKSWYEKYGSKITAVVSQNDEMALGAIKYMEEKGIMGKFPIIGIDAIPDALKAVKEGKLDATVFQDAEGQAKMSLDLAVKIHNGESCAKTYFIPFRLVTRENIDQYLKNR